MGSFYATCSVTHYTICDGQKMYMQFMLPSKHGQGKKSLALMYREIFLKEAKEKGIEDAIKAFDEEIQEWETSEELSPKGLRISDSSGQWVPFGPAIRGTYDDYGNIAPSEDEDSKMRVRILEELMGGLPFDTIMEVASDDRWYTLGLGKYKDESDPNKNWRPEGIHKDMPDWLLGLCKKISMTCFHASVYEEMSSFDFASGERDGILKNKYEKKEKTEWLKGKKDSLEKIIKTVSSAEDEGVDDDKTVKLIKKWEIRTEVFKSDFKNLEWDLALLYIERLALQKDPLDWIFESSCLICSLSQMGIQLRQSDYGSQHENWYGWQRIQKALNPVIEDELKITGDDEDDEANEEM